MLIRHAGRCRMQGGAVGIGRAGRGRQECRHRRKGGRSDVYAVYPRASWCTLVHFGALGKNASASQETPHAKVKESPCRRREMSL